MSCKNFFWRNFLGAHTVQMVPKYIWMLHFMDMDISPYILKFKFFFKNTYSTMIA